MNKNIKIILGLIVAVLVVWGIYSVSKKPSEPMINEPIKIGAILPLSGQYAFFGESERDVINLAFKETGANVEIIFEDDSFDAKKAVSAYHKLISVDNVDILINSDSVAFPAIYPLIKQDEILTFQIFESSARHKDTVFQVMPHGYALFSKLGEISNEKYNTVALVYGSGEFLVKDADYFKQTMSEDKIVYEIMLNPDSDYRTEVTKLLAEKPEATTLFLSLEDGIKFLKAFKNQGGDKNTDLICDANIEIGIGQYVEAVGSDIFEGCFSTNLPDQMTDDFKFKFKQEYNRDPVFSADYAYDIALIISELARHPKSDWLDIAQKTSLKGASGIVEFDEMGTRFPASEVRIFTDGKFVKYTE